MENHMPESQSFSEGGFFNMRNLIKLTLSAFAVLILCAGLLPAQATDAKTDEKQKPKEEKKEEAKPQPQGPPPEYQALFKANGIPDPQLKIEALEKVLKDFPKAGRSFASNVNRVILSTMVKAWPDKRDTILKQARKVVSKAPKDGKSYAFNSVAETLLDAGVLLDDAQSFAEKGLTTLDKKKYIKEQREFAKEFKMPMPLDEELAKAFAARRADNLSVLGRIYLKRGNTAEAEKYLKESFDANPALTETAIALTDISEKAGNEKAALDYLATAVLNGRVRKEDRQKFEALYRKTHNNSLDGIEEFLDERYKKAFPPPIHVDDYKPSESRSKRVVLAEVFTGAGCPPCVAADLGFDAVMERYARDEVAVIMYHQHIPRPDPMTNTVTQKRYSFYGGGGVPTYIIDGETDIGGGLREMTRQFYDHINPVIEKQLEATPEASIRLDAAMDDSTVRVKAEVENVKSGEGAVKLQIALVEDWMRYSGENGIRFHPMVVRSLAGKDADGFVVDPAQHALFEHSFDIPKIVEAIKAHLDKYEADRNKDITDESKRFAFTAKKHEIDPSRLSVVAFVQDEKTKKILQAVYVKLKPGDVAPSNR